MNMNDAPGFLTRVEVVGERITDPDAFPYSLPFVRRLGILRLHPRVTYLVGENGAGKSTLLEAIAIAAGFNPEGGSANFSFGTRSSESSLHAAIRLSRSSRRPRTGFFLRAEAFFNLATHVEALDHEPAFSPPIIDSYGGRSLHEQSHGESFVALLRHRFGPNGLYLLDEPEAALSARTQVRFLERMGDLLETGSQFIIATHSPIIMAHPDSFIYEMTRDEEMRLIAYEQVEAVRTTLNFLETRLQR